MGAGNVSEAFATSYVGGESPLTLFNFTPDLNGSSFRIAKRSVTFQPVIFRLESKCVTLQSIYE